MSERVVVVGGGLVGLCVAFRLGKANVDVTLIDQGRTGQGSSKGNAGWVAPLRAAPLPAPGMVTYGLRSLARPDSPLYINPRALPMLTPWLLRFARCCTGPAREQGVAAMGMLAAGVMPAYERLQRDGVHIELLGQGLIACFSDEAHIEPSLKDVRAVSGHESTAKVIDGDEIRRMEPFLSGAVVGGYVLPLERYVDPERMGAAIRDAAVELGVEIREHVRVEGFEHGPAAVTGVRTSDGRVRASQVVVAAGAWSAEVVRSLGVWLPLQAGKGYSYGVRFPTPLRHSLFLHEAKVAVTPYGNTVRFAGTIEFSGINLRLDQRRIAGIARSAERFFERMPAGRSEEWAGMRPMLPDGLPAIGRLHRYPNVILATGHSTLGVTLAPITGELVERQVLANETPPGFEAFSPSRFGA